MRLYGYGLFIQIELCIDRGEQGGGPGGAVQRDEVTKSWKMDI